ncbi:WD40 repeat domain-containing protein [Blastopirellula marina]|uniref:Uncharacterized protein n=1 Tax=Blastopirellula marina TaxID=124 RepID=A0A2S8GGF1_9BACT|nr:hypothetical protein [Blastopirellula marina]PQO43503.1 hypothetical protein C5Y93_22885 [Blastopirellula marina]
MTYVQASTLVVGVVASSIAWAGNVFGDAPSSINYSAVAIGSDNRLAIGFLADASLGFQLNPPGSFGIIDLKTPQGILRKRIKKPAGISFSPLVDHQSVTALAWSPHGGVLGIGKHDGEVLIWNEQTDSYQLIGKHARCVRGILWAQDGRWVITASDDGRVIAWDVEKRERRRVYGDFQVTALSLAVSQDGRQLAVAGMPGEVLIFDVASGERVAKLPAENLLPISVAFDQKGKRVFCACTPGRIVAWSLEDRRIIAKPFFPNGGPGSIQFLPGESGRIVGVGGNSVEIWDATTMKSIAQISLEVSTSGLLDCVYDSARQRLYAMTRDEIIVIAVGETELSRIETLPK